MVILVIKMWSGKFLVNWYWDTVAPSPTAVLYLHLKLMHYEYIIGLWELSCFYLKVDQNSCIWSILPFSIPFDQHAWPLQHSFCPKLPMLAVFCPLWRSCYNATYCGWKKQTLHKIVPMSGRVVYEKIVLHVKFTFKYWHSY